MKSKDFLSFSLYWPSKSLNRRNRSLCKKWKEIVVVVHTIANCYGCKGSSGKAWRFKFILECPVVLSINCTLHKVDTRRINQDVVNWCIIHLKDISLFLLVISLFDRALLMDWQHLPEPARNGWTGKHSMQYKDYSHTFTCVLGEKSPKFRCI